MGCLEKSSMHRLRVVECVDDQDKVGTMQGQIRLLSEEKDRMNRDALSVQKQLDYYKVHLLLTF
jgi:hypothetical protein